MRLSASDDHPGVDQSTARFYNKIELLLDNAGVAFDDIPYEYHIQALRSVLDDVGMADSISEQDVEFIDTVEIEDRNKYVKSYMDTISRMDEVFFNRDHHERCIDALTQEYMDNRPSFDVLMRNVFYEDRNFRPITADPDYEGLRLPSHRSFEEREWSDADFMAVDTNNKLIEMHQVKRSDLSDPEKRERQERARELIEDVNKEVGENYDVEWHFHIADEFTFSKHPMPEDYDEQVYAESGLGEFQEYLSEMAFDTPKNRGLAEFLV